MSWYRAVGAVLTSAMLALSLLLQSGLVCPDKNHAPHHHHAVQHSHHEVAQAPCDTPAKSETPLCCWTVATCTSPAALTIRTTAPAGRVSARGVAPATMAVPQSVAFAPEIPPPRV
jgi:hypothetical protein